MSDTPPVFPPPAGFAGPDSVTLAQYQERYRQSIQDPDAFWRKTAQRLQWYKEPTKIKNVSFQEDDFRIRWFEDGELNVSVNCLDRHLEKRGDKTAIVWEADSPDAPAQKVTYRELHARVSRLGNALRSLGVAKGDRVTIYLPMVIDAAVALLACARIGAVHNVVFGGFSPTSLADRVRDSSAKVILTADQGLRAGKPIPWYPPYCPSTPETLGLI